MPTRNPKGIIIALDTPSGVQALDWADRLIPHTPYFKVGLELFSAEGPGIVRRLSERGAKIFLDLKLHDIPNTVKKACDAIARLNVWMCTVHASGGEAMLRAAREGLSVVSAPPLLVAVTVLTSAEKTPQTESQVLALAALARNAGCDGVVASAQEAEAVRRVAGPGFVLVTPGIRLEGQSRGDQSRVMTPKAAFQAGSNFLVMGRSLLESPHPDTILQEVMAQCQVSL